MSSTSYSPTRGQKQSQGWLPRFLRSTLALSGLLSLAAVPVANAQSGGSFCASAFCLNAVVEGNNVFYQLQSTLGFTELGWMAVGFGTSMLNSPMVITWPNEEGTITISQRFTAIRQMPEVVENPAQRATLEWRYSNLATNSTTITFSQARPSDLSRVNMIYAYSRSRPSSSDPDAVIERHTNAGTFVINLTGATTALTTGTFSAPPPTATGTLVTTRRTGTASPTVVPTAVAAQATPLSSYQRKLVTHGILTSIGFLIFLPIGVLIPRYTRTVPALRARWFTAHWIVQLIFSGPLILAGWALGYQSASFTGGGHFIDTHKRVGLALFIMYICQVALGAFIHFIKPKPKAAPVADKGMSEKQVGYVRPPQNYLHGILGLSIIGLALFNVREGYKYEFPAFSGIRGTSELKMVNSWWMAWVVIVPILYAAGLVLLPRQYRMERNVGKPAADNESGSNLVPLDQRKAKQ